MPGDFLAVAEHSRSRGMTRIENAQMMFMRSFPAIVFLLQGVCTLAAEAESVHWHQFRGPNGAGTAAGFKPPLKIVAQQAAWRTPQSFGENEST